MTQAGDLECQVLRGPREGCPKCSMEEGVSMCWGPDMVLQSSLLSTLGGWLPPRMELGASPLVLPRLPGLAQGPAPLKSPQP